MPNFENAFKTVCELVEDFKENEARYLSPQYQEAEVRRDYIDKMLEALGWDVYHRTQKNPYAQEVKVEKSVNVGKAQKRADYAFYISPEFRQPKYFVEAKKPSRNLKNADDYFQTIRYGWNANTPVAVLTDFQEFHVLDCRYKPNIKSVLDNPNHKTYVYTDYADREKFGEIFYLFNRDDVAKSSLENYSSKFEKIKGKAKLKLKESLQSIDDDFLEYIDEVRETLAKAFKKNDANLTSEELTEATQRTIDRIVFIRFLEDKLIEPEYYVSEFGKKGNAWTEFISVCRKLDAKYNGIVFKKHFIDEQSFQGPEQSTFRKICEDISYLNSPYDFNAIPIHILGSIYERFLGKVVNATAQRVKVEEKPEVRKAGGVYYTPKYIVDYIVDNTVGKIIRNENAPSLSSRNDSSSLSSPRDLGGDLIMANKDNTFIQDTRQEHAGMTGAGGKTPADISKLRFADIACGSGSFLIGVFETLLKYHTEYYQSHPEQAKKDGCINKDGQWILSIKQKQNILLNNIYGVDIDNQAVEVTQLSLALKMLEDETTATANEMQVLFHEKILPDLSKNIVCGNSLIGTDIVYEESTDGLFERKRKITIEEERKLNPMDFEKRFPEIMKNGGFDAIVGNPPYVRQESFKSIKEYLNIKYSEISDNTADLYVYFIFRCIKLLKSSSYFGYIISNKFTRANYGKKLRCFLKNNVSIVEYIDKFEKKVFKDAAVDPCIIITNNKHSNGNKIIYNKEYILQSNLKDESWTFASNNILNLKNKIETLGKRIVDYKNVKIYFGIKSGLSSVYILNEEKKNQLIKKDATIDRYLKKLIRGRDIKKYTIEWDNLYLLDIRIGIDISKNEVLYSYFLEYKNQLLKRTDYKSSIMNWYNLRPCSYYDEFEKPKIIYPDISENGGFCWDEENYYFNNTIYMICNAPKYWTALLNSKLLTWYYKQIASNLGEKGIRYFTQFVEQIPIIERIPNEGLLTQLVEQMLEAKKQLQTVKTDRDKTYYENKCTDLDHAIDSEVYKLYGLTEEEIKIVEGKE